MWLETPWSDVVNSQKSRPNICRWHYLTLARRHGPLRRIKAFSHLRIHLKIINFAIPLSLKVCREYSAPLLICMCIYTYKSESAHVYISYERRKHIIYLNRLPGTGYWVKQSDIWILGFRALINYFHGTEDPVVLSRSGNSPTVDNTLPLMFFWPCIMNWLHINYQIDVLIIIYS